MSKLLPTSCSNPRKVVAFKFLLDCLLEPETSGCILWLWVVVGVWFTVSPTPWWGKNHWLDFASVKNKTHLGFPQTLDEFWDPEWFVTTFHKKGTLAKAVLKLCVVLMLLVFWKVLTSIEATTFSYMFRI